MHGAFFYLNSIDNIELTINYPDVMAKLSLVNILPNKIAVATSKIKKSSKNWIFHNSIYFNFLSM